VQDGFQLAEEDLKMRGPGEFFGTRQSGIPDLKMAKISDVALLEQARQEAIVLFEEDPTLQSPENRLLANEMSRVWAKGESEWS
jgi:ATP-dependent DNA helicase RecG